MRRTILAFCYPLFLFLTACLPRVQPHPIVILNLAGSTAMQPLLQELGEAYEEQRDYVRFEMRGVGSEAGLEALAAGLADIALVSRELTAEEEEQWQYDLLAWDLLAIVVNADRQLDSLSHEVGQRVFTGQITSWEELGIEDGDIQVATREEGSGTRQFFIERVLAGQRITSTAIVLPTEQAMAEYIDQNPQAIGYASLAVLSSDVVAVAIDGQPAELSTDRYPFVRPFFLVTRQKASREVEDFIRFCLGPQGQAIVAMKYRRAVEG